jgi:xanthine dehydrogenase molybdenum-binding subunit
MDQPLAMVRFVLNGLEIEARGGRSLLSFLRDDAGLTAAKNACGEGVCGACSVVVNGGLVRSCVTPIERVGGANVLTLEGLDSAEMDVYAQAFAEAGAVQCGYCTPGMILAAKVLLDRNPAPSETEVRAALRGNLCRCTGYARIVAAVLSAAERLRALRAKAAAASSLGPSSATGPQGGGRAAPAFVGERLVRVDAIEKARGKALFVDDLKAEGMLYGAVLRTPHPRARLVSLDVTAARKLPGVSVVADWRDIPGSRFTGHIVADWPTLVAPGEVTHYVGDAVALVAAESREAARAALDAIVARYEVLDPVASPAEALAPDAPVLHPEGNVLSRFVLRRGDAAAALASADFMVEERFETPFTDHAYLEPESALAFPPDAEGVVLVRTGEQNVYSGRKYVYDTLGLPHERVRVVSAYVGGAFGGKEDQSVQHHAALLAWLAGRPVKLTLSRAESTRVHVKRHAMTISLRLGCDREGRLLGLESRIVADTGAYASLGTPVIQRAVIHAGGPYSYRNVDIEGLAVYTNNPPSGAFRGFGVPQVTFALESALDRLAAEAGISAWEIRRRNAIRPGEELPNGQLAGTDTALVECLDAVRDDFEKSRGPVGLACGFKNVGLGVGHADIGRCVLKVHEDRLEILTGAACIGQGLATILVQVASQVTGVEPAFIAVAQPDTLSTPDSGTTTASRQTLVTGEACRRACEAALEALEEARGRQASGDSDERGGTRHRLSVLAGREFRGEYHAATDPFDSAKANPVRHVAYSYACQLVELEESGRVARVVAAHDSGLVVNPLSFEGQVEGGVAMGLGYALTEDFPLAGCVPTATFGRLGLLRASDVPPVKTIIVRKIGDGAALDGGVSGAAYGAKGIGEISTIPTAAAVAGAWFAKDGVLRTRLPIDGTPYRRAEGNKPRAAPPR